MLKTSTFPFSSLAVYCTVLVGLSLIVFLSTRPAAAATFTGVMGERTRITLGYQVKADALGQMFPAPWQPDPAATGSPSSCLPKSARNSWDSYRRSRGDELHHNT